MDESYLTVNDVSLLYSISKRTLQYYDEIGLLSPKRLDNDYRVYTSENLDLLEVILLLKDSGVSLDNIKSYINAKTLKEKKLILQGQKDSFLEMIIEYQRKIDRLNKEIKQLTKLQHVTYDKLYVDYLPKKEHTPVKIGKTKGMMLVVNVDMAIETELSSEDFSFVSFNQFKIIEKTKVKKAYIYHKENQNDLNKEEILVNFKKQIEVRNLIIDSNIYCFHHIWVEEGSILYLECNVIDD